LVLLLKGQNRYYATHKILSQQSDKVEVNLLFLQYHKKNLTLKKLYNFFNNQSGELKA